MLQGGVTGDGGGGYCQIGLPVSFHDVAVKADEASGGSIYVCMFCIYMWIVKMDVFSIWNTTTATAITRTIYLLYVV